MTTDTELSLLQQAMSILAAVKKSDWTEIARRAQAGPRLNTPRFGRLWSLGLVPLVPSSFVGFPLVATQKVNCLDGSSRIKHALEWRSLIL